MMDLFRHFERMIRNAIAGEFRNGRFGRFSSQLDALKRRVGASRSRAAQYVRDFARRSRSEMRARVDRYALGSMFTAAREALADLLSKVIRPIVNLLHGLAGRGGGRGATPTLPTVPPTIPAAGAGGASRVPPSIATGGAGGPGGPGSTGSGSVAGGGRNDPDDFDRRIQDAIDLLTQQGYTVAPPSGRRGGGDMTREDLGFQRNPPEGEGVPPATQPPFRSGMGRDHRVVGHRTREFDPDDPIYTGEMIPVTSSNVHSIGYIWNANDPTKGTLKVRFLQQSRGGKRGKEAGPLYYYYGVHPFVFDAFRRTGSPGGFVWDRLRIRGTVSGHRFHYDLKGISNGYIPRKATRYGSNEYFIRRRAKFRSERTGQVREFESSLPSQFVQTLSTGPGGGRRTGPHGMVPREPYRGQPNRGRPNRGKRGGP